MDGLKGAILLLDVIGQWYQHFDEKISDSGGLANFFTLHRKFRDALGAVSDTELAVFLSDIQRAKEALSRLQDEIIEIHTLKQAIELGASSSASGKLAEENQSTKK